MFSGESVMTRTNVVLLLAMAVLVSMLFVGGCSSETTVPHMKFGSFDMRAQLSREDIVVLERIKGTSTTTSIFCGLIQVVDGDKWIVLWVLPFFKDRYTSVSRDEFSDYYRLLHGGSLLERLLVTTEDRAYHKALEATPEADAVFYKRMDREISGFPLLWQTTTVTFSGKAITLKADQEVAKL